MSLKDLRHELISDIFICELEAKYSNIRERLLTEDNVSLHKAVSIAKINSTILQQDIDVDGIINVVNKKGV